MASPLCQHCEGLKDMLRHVLLECRRWSLERADLLSEVGHLHVGNLIEKMKRADDSRDALSCGSRIRWWTRRKRKEEMRKMLVEWEMWVHRRQDRQTAQAFSKSITYSLCIHLFIYSSICLFNSIKSNLIYLYFFYLNDTYASTYIF